jgi:hypothetical protein
LQLMNSHRNLGKIELFQLMLIGADTRIERDYHCSRKDAHMFHATVFKYLNPRNMIEVEE